MSGPETVNDRVASEPDLAVIAPCFNEEPNILALSERIGAALAGHPGGFELVLVDDGSSDGTWERIREAARLHDFVVPARHEKNRGLVEGWRTGMYAAHARRLVTIDADLQYRPEDIPLLVEAMDREHADFVQGWRQTQVKRGFLRTLLTAGLSVFLNVLFGMRLRDIKSGFVLYTRESMRVVLDFHYPFRYFQHFIAVAAHASRLKIVQVPITFDPRHAGESFITQPLKFSLQALEDIPRAFGEFYRRRALLRASAAAKPTRGTA